MSLFDRLFRRGRGGAGSARPGPADSTASTYTTAPVHHSAGGGQGDPDGGRGDREDAGRAGDDRVEPSVQEIQVGEASAPDQGARSDGEPASQQVDVGDSGGGDSGGGDSGGGDSGGGGDGGGGGGE